LAAICHGLRLKQPRRCSAKVYELLLLCWDLDPKRRPKVGKLVMKFRQFKEEDSKLSEPSNSMELSLGMTADPQTMKVNQSVPTLSWEKPLLVPEYGSLNEAKMLATEVLNVKLPDSLTINPNARPILELEEPSEYFCPSSHQLCYYDEVAKQWLDYTEKDLFSQSPDKISVAIPHFTPVALRNRRLREVYNIDPQFLDSQHNFDFTNVVDANPTPHRRGPEPYIRPCGWMRFAINVSSKHGPDMKWLGTGNSDDVWPVAYHGTHQENVPGILVHSLQVGGTNNVKARNGAVFGTGIYLSPKWEVAQGYSTGIPVPGLGTVKVVFQVRVHTGNYKKHNANIWTVPDPADVRPYGVLFKVIPP